MPKIKDIVSLEEKINLILEYIKLNPGEKITNKTIYKGYNIGIFLNGIRSDYNRYKIKNETSGLLQLIKLGLLEPQEGKIDDLIGNLLKWQKAHPEKPFYSPSKKSKNTDDEEFVKVVAAYRYISKRRGKLTEEQLKLVEHFLKNNPQSLKLAEKLGISEVQARDLLYVGIDKYFMSAIEECENPSKGVRTSFEKRLANFSINVDDFDDNSLSMFANKFRKEKKDIGVLVYSKSRFWNEIKKLFLNPSVTPENINIFCQVFGIVLPPNWNSNRTDAVNKMYIVPEKAISYKEIAENISFSRLRNS